jgi:hypothetical protein
MLKLTTQLAYLGTESVRNHRRDVGSSGSIHIKMFNMLDLL